MTAKARFLQRLAESLKSQQSRVQANREHRKFYNSGKRKGPTR